MKNPIIVVAFFAILTAALLISGCLGVTMHTTVNGDGKITEVSTELNLSETNYDLYKSIVQMSSPGQDMKSYFVDNYSEMYSGPGTVVDYKERKLNGYVYITLTARGSDIQPQEGSNVTVTKEGDYWVYRYLTSGAASSSSIPTDTSSLSDSMANMVTLDFYLTMPGNIVDSNAQKIDGNKAEWHLNGNTLNSVDSLYAKSEVAKSPGFEAIVALMALAAGVYLVAMRKKE